MLIVALTVINVPDDVMLKISQMRYFQYSAIYSYCWPLFMTGNFSDVGRALLHLQSWVRLLPLGIINLVGIVRLALAVPRRSEYSAG
jgi:hypothetical protein